jgi:hypothetical protein
MDGAIWPPLLEKAYAKFNRGYDKINKGSLAALTFKYLKDYPSAIHLTDDDSCVDCVIADALADNNFVTAGTWSWIEDEVDMGLMSSHSYSVHGVYYCHGDDHAFVHIRDTWGATTLFNGTKVVADPTYTNLL